MSEVEQNTPTRKSFLSVKSSSPLLPNEFKFVNTPDADALVKEIFSDNYKILTTGLKFRPKDVIIDAGANEGVFSIWMSRLFPETRIIALEPVPRTFATLEENIRLNDCKNIEVKNIGLGPNFKQSISMVTNKSGQSGGSTACCTFNPEGHEMVDVKLMPLDAVFEYFNIRHCELLKMDIEGMEYDVLYASKELRRVTYFCGEFHMNNRLDYESRRLDGLVNWMNKQVKIVHLEMCKMAE